MSSSQAQIPVIDIGPSNPDAPHQLLSAASKHGFVFVENNDAAGVSAREIAEMFSLSKTFFAGPIEEKEKVSIASNKAGKNHGWLSRGVEKLDPATQKRPDVKEAFNMGTPSPHTQTFDQPLPSTLAPHTPSLIAFQNSCHALCQTLLRHFATALEIPADWFTTRHDQSKGPSGTVFRLLYYPALPSSDDDDEIEPGIDIRAGAHSDYGSLTLLFQLPGQPGLEILTPDGEWAAVPVDPTTASSSDSKSRALPILVNIGDLLEDWTRGLLKSTVHRVIFPGGESKDRYSIAYFNHPLDDALLEAVPSGKVRDFAAEHGRKAGRDGDVITARDHLMRRLEASVAVTAAT